MTALTDAAAAGAPAGELARCPLPATYRAAHLRKSDVGMFGETDDKDVRKSLHVGEVPMPELAPDEVLIAFTFLARFGRQGRWAARHDLPYHVLGSDAAGVVVRAGDGVRRWSAGDAVVISPAYIDHEDPAAQDDSMNAAEPLAWGFETNFGALADFAVVKASQLLAKPPHLTWEEAASTTLCAGTAYRMLVSRRGATMKQGDVVLIWGATGGLGGYAVQLVARGGGIPVGVVSSPARAELARKLGCAGVINRAELNGTLADVKGWRRLGEEIRRQVGEDPHEYDNRHLWMKVKRIIGSHGANYQENWEMNRLVTLGMLVPTLSSVYPLSQVGEATRAVQQGRHIGKTAVLCLAPREGLGVQDPAARERAGEDRLRLFREA